VVLFALWWVIPSRTFRYCPCIPDPKLPSCPLVTFKLFFSESLCPSLRALNESPPCTYLLSFLAPSIFFYSVYPQIPPPLTARSPHDSLQAAVSFWFGCIYVQLSSRHLIRLFDIHLQPINATRVRACIRRSHAPSLIGPHRGPQICRWIPKFSFFASKSAPDASLFDSRPFLPSFGKKLLAALIPTSLSLRAPVFPIRDLVPSMACRFLHFFKSILIPFAHFNV